MPTARLIHSAVTRSVPPYTIAEWEDTTGVDATSASAQLIILPLPNSITRIDLKLFSVACNSTNFDVHMLDMNDISVLNTIHEVLAYTNESLSFVDNDFRNYTIMNRDSTETNRLYLYIVNNSTTATGTITIRMSYLPIST